MGDAAQPQKKKKDKKPKANTNIPNRKKLRGVLDDLSV